MCLRQRMRARERQTDIISIQCIMCKHCLYHIEIALYACRWYTASKPSNKRFLSSSPLFPVCLCLSLSLSPSVCGCERLVLLLSFQKSTRVCSVRERVYASLMPSVDLTPVLRPIRITCYFFLHSIFLHHFNRCVFFNGIFFVRFVCNTFYSCFFSIFLSLSHWMLCLCATVFTLCNFSFSKVIFWCDGAVSSL